MIPPHDSRRSPHCPHVRGRGGCLRSGRLLFLLAAIGGAARLAADEPAARAEVEDLCHRFLSNPVIEDTVVDLTVVEAPLSRPVVLALAVRFGATRLIDNRVLASG
jgi:pantothenate synthetase